MDQKSSHERNHSYFKLELQKCNIETFHNMEKSTECNTAAVSRSFESSIKKTVSAMLTISWRKEFNYF